MDIMTIGRVLFSKSNLGDGGWRVDTDTSGVMMYVGRVWPERDLSPEGKASKRARKIWFARVPGPSADTPAIGPFATRSDAAKALY